MLTLPHKLTLFQGFDALFHASECYVNNGNENRLAEHFAVDAIEKVAKHLPIVSEDGSNLESRSNISYAANILCGFTQSLVCTTSHHIIAQALGGFFPNVPHGASLLLIADAYYKKVCSLLPTEFDAIGEIMARKGRPRQARLRLRDRPCQAHGAYRHGQARHVRLQHQQGRRRPRWPISPPPKSGSSATATPSRKRTWSKS